MHCNALAHGGKRWPATTSGVVEWTHVRVFSARLARPLLWFCNYTLVLFSALSGAGPVFAYLIWGFLCPRLGRLAHGDNTGHYLRRSLVQAARQCTVRSAAGAGYTVG